MQLWDQLIVRNGMLYRQHENEYGSGSHLQLVVPRQACEEILQDIHGGVVGGHLGREEDFEPAEGEVLLARTV